MFDKDYNGLTAKKGVLILFICLMLTATIIITNYLPYTTQRDFEAKCTSIATGKVFAVEEQHLDGNMYYGPMIEYYCSERGQLVHAEAASAVKHTRTYKEGDRVNIGYDPNLPGDLYISDDKTAEEHWKMAFSFGVGISAIGIILLFVGCIRSIKGPDKELNARKYFKTPDGKTYNEWLEDQRKKKQESTEEQE